MLSLVWRNINSIESALVDSASQTIESGFVISTSKPVAALSLVVDEPFTANVSEVDQPSANVIEISQSLLDAEAYKVLDDASYLGAIY